MNPKQQDRADFLTATARPGSVVFLSACLGISCLLPASANVAIAAVALIVTAYITGRTVDKWKQGNVEIARVNAAGGAAPGAADP